MRPASGPRPVLAVLTALLLTAGVSLLSAGSASAQMPTFSMAPTSGPPGTTVSFASVTPCPVGATSAVLSNVASPTPGDIVASAVPDKAGAWSTTYDIPAATPAGTLTFYAFCDTPTITIPTIGAAPSAISMTYQPLDFTVTTPTTSSTASTTSTTAPAPMWLDLDKQSYVQGTQMKMNTGGWMPGTPVNIVINSDPIDLGAALANSIGELDHSWMIPVDMPVGTHTVTMTGLDLAGSLVSLSQPFDVTPLAGALADLATTTTAAAVAAASLPATGVTPYTVPLTILGGLLALGGAGLVAAERQRRSRVVLVGAAGRAETRQRPEPPPGPPVS